MYQLFYEKRVAKDLDRIPEKEAIRILHVFQALSTNPLPIGSKKLSGKSSLYRVRQGNYRIIYTVDHNERIVRIILVSHRKDVYREL